MENKYKIFTLKKYHPDSLELELYSDSRDFTFKIKYLPKVISGYGLLPPLKENTRVLVFLPTVNLEEAIAFSFLPEIPEEADFTKLNLFFEDHRFVFGNEEFYLKKIGEEEKIFSFDLNSIKISLNRKGKELFSINLEKKKIFFDGDIDITGKIEANEVESKKGGIVSLSNHTHKYKDDDTVEKVLKSIDKDTSAPNPKKISTQKSDT